MSTPIGTPNQQLQGLGSTPPSAIHGERVGAAIGSALPLYLTVAIMTSPDIIADSCEDNEEVGDGGDSDEEAEIADDHQEALLEVQRERALLVGDYDDDAAVVADNDATAVLLHRGSRHVTLPEIQLPGTPPDWTPPARKEGEPEFEFIDNPNKWCQFAFCPEFDKQGIYVRHSLPTLADVTVFPERYPPRICTRRKRTQVREPK